MENKTYKIIQNSLTFGGPGLVSIVGIMLLINGEMKIGIFILFSSVIALLLHRLQDKRDKRMNIDVVEKEGEQ